MNRFTQEQLRRNQEARAGWELYQNHRAHVTALLTDPATNPSGKLCVLGAGNCNDLDLAALLKHYRSIELVDLDGQALQQGCAFQRVDTTRVSLTNTDVTGLAETLTNWSTQPPDQAEFTAVSQQALLRTQLPLATLPCDMAVSLGLLTQLLELAEFALGTRHPWYLPLLSAIRLQHLRVLLNLVRPGGQAWLIWEVVSSITCPQILTTPDSGLRAVMQQAVASHNFFTGTNPGVLWQLFQTDPELKTRVAGLTAPTPWRWDFFTRSYAVCVIGVQCR